MSGLEMFALEQLLGIVGKSSKGLYGLLKKIRNAPKEFSALTDEVLRLYSVLKDVQDARNHENMPPSLATLVSEAKKTLQEVDNLVAYVLTAPGEEDKVKRTTWARKSGQAQKLVEDVRRLTGQFTTPIAVATFGVAGKIAEIQSLHFEALTKKLDYQDEKFDDHSIRTQVALAQLQQQALASHDTTRNIPAIVGVQRAVVGDALEQIKSITEQSTKTQSKRFDQIQQQSLETQATTSKISATLIAQHAVSSDALGRIELRSEQSTETQRQHYEQSIQRFDRLEQLMIATSERPRQRNAIMITDSHSGSTSIHTTRTITLHSDTWCPKGCRCPCHKSYKLNTPRAAANWTGSIQAQFSGPSWLRPACTHPKCKRKLLHPTGFQYTLPLWLAGKMYAAWYRSAPLSGPEFLLKVARVHESNAFYYAQEGDLERLQALYSAGGALIDDMHPLDGSSAFNVALQSKQYDVAAFLKELGANIEQQDFTGARSSYIAMHISIFDTRHGESNTIGKIFDVEDLLEDTNFSLLHKIVCGLSKSDLEEVLGGQSRSINARDSSGRTPLAWAAYLDDLDMVKMLLEHGADIASTDDVGANLFHYLHGGASLPILQFLLESEYSLHSRNLVNQANKYGAAPWYLIKDGDVLSMHIRHGCDLTVRDGINRTALHIAMRDDCDAAFAEVLMIPEISRIDLAAKTIGGYTAYDRYKIEYYTWSKEASPEGRAKWALLEYAVSLKYGGDGTTKHDQDDFIRAFGLDPEVTEWVEPRSILEVSSDDDDDGEDDDDEDEDEEDEDEDDEDDEDLFEDAQDQLEPDIDQESSNASPAP